MHRIVNGLLVNGLLVFSLVAAVGCTGSPVGDPCVPESIPPGGFDNREVYLETSSVQCRTRVCMVYQLDGDPTELPPDDQDLDQVFCSCRCSIAEGEQANQPLCACGAGFECIDDIVTTGGEGVRGGYCVPCVLPGNPENLDITIFDDCPVE